MKGRQIHHCKNWNGELLMRIETVVWGRKKRPVNLFAVDRTSGQWPRTRTYIWKSSWLPLKAESESLEARSLVTNQGYLGNWRTPFLQHAVREGHEARCTRGSLRCLRWGSKVAVLLVEADPTFTNSFHLRSPRDIHLASWSSQLSERVTGLEQQFRGMGTLAGIHAGYLWSSRKNHVTSFLGENISDGTGRMNTVRKTVGLTVGEEERGKHGQRAIWGARAWHIWRIKKWSVQLQRGAHSFWWWISNINLHLLCARPCHKQTHYEYWLIKSAQQPSELETVVHLVLPKGKLWIRKVRIHDIKPEP